MENELGHRGLDESKASWTKLLPFLPLVERDDYLLGIARGRSVLHVGATDYPFTADAASSGSLLHLKLAKEVRYLQGIDISADAVSFLRESYGVTDIAVLDACRPLDALGSQRFEVILCCDVIEHLSNPGLMLDNLRPYLAAEGKLVVTTINSLALKPALRALLRGRESVHPDHCFYFSLSNMQELLRRSGFSLREVRNFRYQEKGFVTKIVFDLLYSVRPQAGDGILCIAT